MTRCLKVKGKPSATSQTFSVGFILTSTLLKLLKKAIAETEKVLVTANVQEDVRGWTNEAMNVCMICTRCKGFAAGADEKNGVYGHFIVFVRAFLRQHDLHSLPIVPIRGSHFNIMFNNAAGVFFLHHEML